MKCKVLDATWQTSCQRFLSAIFLAVFLLKYSCSWRVKILNALLQSNHVINGHPVSDIGAITFNVGFTGNILKPALSNLIQILVLVFFKQEKLFCISCVLIFFFSPFLRAISTC